MKSFIFHIYFLEKGVYLLFIFWVFTLLVFKNLELEEITFKVQASALFTQF